MSRLARYTILILAVVVCAFNVFCKLVADILKVGVHYTLSSIHDEYGRATAFSNIASKFRGGDESTPDSYTPRPNPNPESPPSGPRLANATFVMLARNSDLDGAMRAVRAVEDRFNTRHGYPYVFLNDVEFSSEFKRRMSVLTGFNAVFGVIPSDHWNQPDWIDEDKATEARKSMVAANVKYGGTHTHNFLILQIESYRNMCRFNSGFFFKHPLLQKYRWYWRIEPNVQFHCNILNDPFLFLEENNKVYGFTITVYEIAASIRSLWGHVTDFIAQHPEHIAEDNSMGFLSGNRGKTYNTCHFWSNFEIADMEFWRGPAYTDFFVHLDRTGGFYYERWGDAPVHSIAASLFLRKDQIHFFEEIGYQHDDWSHCPIPEDLWIKGRCSCDQKHSFDYDGSSCKRKWDRFMNGS
ncbi:glycosyltransferase family 15 protein [Desarmillaria ectypa]|nr:glycosyltransferase family 15 protein [Desarmillaria ectypa]